MSKVHTIIDGTPRAMSRSFFEMVQEYRAKKNLPALEELASTEDDIPTYPLMGDDEWDSERSPDRNVDSALKTIVIVLAILIVIGVVTFLLGLSWLVMGGIHTSSFEWMGTHRAAMIPIECILALNYGLLS